MQFIRMICWRRYKNLILYLILFLFFILLILTFLVYQELIKTNERHQKEILRAQSSALIQEKIKVQNISSADSKDSILKDHNELNHSDCEHMDPKNHADCSSDNADNEGLLFVLFLGALIEGGLRMLFEFAKSTTDELHGIGVDSSEIFLNETTILSIKDEISRINDEQYIFNQDVFGPLTENDTVILIQVHNRLDNLKYLVESLIDAKYINTSLVIFSHDFWDDDINNIIRNISAFKVMQIFYPYTVQLNPYNYPGTDPRDCAWNQNEINKELKDDEKVQCLNLYWPDIFGRYREVVFTQLKHYWWWKLVQVFEKTRELDSFTGQVLLLEEHHLVLPDILHVLKLLVKERNKSYRSYHIFGLGNYDSVSSSKANLMERGDWIGEFGCAFNRTIYNILKKCQSDFCNYDDYNYDWTIRFIATTCALNKLTMLSTSYSRIIHISSCGTHYRKSEENCSIVDSVTRAKEMIKEDYSGFFPTSLYMKKHVSKASIPSPNGGWGDNRDKILCQVFLNDTHYIETVLDELQFHSIKQGEIAQ